MSGEQDNNNGGLPAEAQIGMYEPADNSAPEASANAAPEAAAPEAAAPEEFPPETLHMAARAGSLDSVKMLIRNGAKPEDMDKDGKTALQHAQEAGKDDIAQHLQEVMDANRKASEPEDKYDQSFEEASPSPSPAAATTPAATAPAAAAPPADTTPAVQMDAPAEEPKDAIDAIQEEIAASNSPPQGNRILSPKSGISSPQKSPTGASRAGDDLKARTMFSMSTTDGVLKRTTFIHKLSGYHSAPEISIASRGGSMFTRTGQSPSPGSYNLPDDEKSKFKSTARFSFGGGSRFGLGQSPTKQQPGPGAYNPKDPSLYVDTKVGFGTSVRNKGAAGSQANPGPGAYENRSTVGGGIMCTARGRHPQSYMRSRSLPGPGAYTPTLAGAYQTSPKCGFGTSVRGDFTGGGTRGLPGPGTYEMQNFKCMGKDSAKFSATSRRRMHDLNSYVTPGPGTYNAHATSFGSPGAYSCSHVDEGYKARHEARQMEMGESQGHNDSRGMSA